VRNVTVHVLDVSLRPLPAGVVGEIYIGGCAPARGYAGRPDLTAAYFLPDPLSAVPGSRMYRTRDSGRRLNNGEIEFVGRIDEQVKVRGYRIEPREIEICLQRLPSVRHAVVAARDEGVRGKSLAAYVVPEQPGTITSQDVRAWLAQHLPEFMMPSRIVVVDRIADECVWQG